ncbi:MAG: IMP dehydrogenase [Patescibacteria group bacterium]
MIKEGLTFDDVLLSPRKSRVFSRKDIITKSKLSRNISLDIPLISANMDTVTESKMARAMAEAGGIGIIHRFLSIERQTEEVRKVKMAESVVIEDPLTAEPTETIFKVRERIKKEGVSSVLAVKKKDGKNLLVGILTSRDLLFEDDNKYVASSDAASDKKRLDNESEDGLFRSLEGASGRVSFRGDASMILTDLISGLRSSMSYLGAKDLKTSEII